MARALIVVVPVWSELAGIPVDHDLVLGDVVAAVAGLRVVRIAKARLHRLWRWDPAGEGSSSWPGSGVAGR